MIFEQLANGATFIRSRKINNNVVYLYSSGELVSICWTINRQGYVMSMLTKGRPDSFYFNNLLVTIEECIEIQQKEIK